jgi:hypothetical protein
VFACAFIGEKKREREKTSLEFRSFKVGIRRERERERSQPSEKETIIKNSTNYFFFSSQVSLDERSIDNIDKKTTKSKPFKIIRVERFKLSTICTKLLL